MRPSEGRSDPAPPPSTMLQALPEQGRAQVLSVAQRRTYRRGEFVLRQGDDAGSLFIIESGRVRIRVVEPGGSGLTLNVLGRGDVFGEMGLLLPQRERTATAEALDEVTVQVLRKEAFDRIRAQHPQANDFLLQILARRVDRLSRRLVEAYTTPVDQRVARRLLEVGRLFAESERPVVLPLTQEDVAQMAGATRPTVNQVLKRLEAVGAVRLVRGQVELTDVGELRRRCRSA